MLPAESGTPIVSTLDADGNPLATDPPATDPQPTLPGEDASLVRELVDFERRQRQLVLATVVISAFALPISALVWDLPTAGSVLVGALAGLLYLRLLARSVQRLGTASKQMGRAQLLVPVVLVLMAAKVPQLQLLPALLGFLLYKPALFLQARPDA
ncbi:MAG: ATP synthase [Cyanobacteria bacterium]|nr:ATP synthase [Cyanobacteriota bacterium]